MPLADPLLVAVQKFLDDTLQTQDRVFRVDVYNALKSEHTLTEVTFCAYLSEDINKGRLTGVELRGRGGIRKIVEAAPPPWDPLADDEGASPPPPSAISSTARPTPPKAIPEVKAKIPDGYQSARFIWVGRNLYLVPKSPDMIRTLLFTVLECREDPEGNVTIGGHKVKCDYPEILVRFLERLFMARSMGESDPILDDGSGLTTEMRIGSGLVDSPIGGP